jgi:Xaa-Pro aminopeptidase
VLKAQERAIASIRPGVLASKVDKAARTVIEKAGFGKSFGHGLGHGVGLDIHEDPRLSKTNSETLRPGMVITIEPGIYVTGFGGVRIEDDVLVTRDGHEVLTSVPKQWDETSAIL